MDHISGSMRYAAAAVAAWLLSFEISIRLSYFNYAPLVVQSVRLFSPRLVKCTETHGRRIVGLGRGIYFAIDATELYVCVCVGLPN